MYDWSIIAKFITICMILIINIHRASTFIFCIITVFIYIIYLCGIIILSKPIIAVFHDELIINNLCLFLFAALYKLTLYLLLF